MKKIKIAEQEIKILLKIVKEKQDILFCLKAEAMNPEINNKWIYLQKI